VDPFAYLRDALMRINSHPSRIDEMLPYRWAPLTAAA
jgi:hypothetical protein